jgi:hypothetical protein
MTVAKIAAESALPWRRFDPGDCDRSPIGVDRTASQSISATGMCASTAGEGTGATTTSLFCPPVEGAAQHCRSAGACATLRRPRRPIGGGQMSRLIVYVRVWTRIQTPSTNCTDSFGRTRSSGRLTKPNCSNNPTSSSMNRWRHRGSPYPGSSEVRSRRRTASLVTVAGHWCASMADMPTHIRHGPDRPLLATVHMRRGFGSRPLSSTASSLAPQPGVRSQLSAEYDRYPRWAT